MADTDMQFRGFWRGEVDEITHLLLTYDGGRLYSNTSAGVVAVPGRRTAAHYGSRIIRGLARRPVLILITGGDTYRDLTPCLAWKDLFISRRKIVTAFSHCFRDRAARLDVAGRRGG